MILEKNNHIARIKGNEKLSQIEQELIEKGFTLGFLPYCNSQMTAEDYLVDQYNVNLQPLIAGVEWEFVSGKLFVNPKSPHSAAGPDLKYLLFKTGTNRKKQLGQLVQARFRVYPLDQLAAGVFLFPEKAKAVSACRSIRDQWLSPYAMHLYAANEFPLLKDVQGDKKSAKGKDYTALMTPDSWIMLVFFVTHVNVQRMYLEKCRDICRSSTYQARVLSGNLAEQFFNERFSYSMLKNYYPQWPEPLPEDRDSLQKISSQMKNSMNQTSKKS